jgi:hypothetical protein
MEPAGWAIMIVSVGSVCALTTFCFYRVMTMPPQAEVHSPLDIDTRDTQDAD